MLELLDCIVMPYPWGSKTSIPALTGRTPSDKPEAELWMGAHPVAPSKVHGVSLVDTIARSPEATVGSEVMTAFGPRLPFLLKVLAAAEPLSLQAHPDLARAKAGFEDEDRRGVPRDAPHRNYKDASHKPELLCALGPFVALSGFRAIPDTLRMFDLLGIEPLEPLLRPLRESADLARTFEAIMTLRGDDKDRLVAATVLACSRTDHQAFADERAWALRLADLYPNDIGIVSALLLQLVKLEAGDAIYLGAGNLHAYLEGTGVELMASSDNVLRGGLTKKHVDVPELLAVLDFNAGPAPIVRPTPSDDGEMVYETPAREFRLSRFDLRTPVTRTPRGPEILLATEGAFTVTRDGRTVQLAKGCSAFVGATGGPYSAEGEGTLFRATTNL